MKSVPLILNNAISYCRFGGYKSRSQVPKLVEQNLNGQLPIDHFITHVFQGVQGTNEAIEALHSGECLRAVARY